MNREEYLKFRETCAHSTQAGHEHETFGWWCQTHAEEFWSILEELNRIQARIILELGTNHGGSAVFWDQQVGPEGQVITVDHPLMPHSRGLIDISPYTPLSNFTALLNDSHLPETLEKVEGLLTGPVDFLFIDGDHSYEGAKQDYEMYGPLVRSGGLIAIDDCVIMPTAVGRMWNEIEANKKMLPIPESGGHGIGLIYV